MSCRNKRIAFFNEVEEETNINCAIIKEICGMDETSYRGLYDTKMSSFVMNCIPILLCNTKPNVSDRTNSIWRRIVSIHFKANFTETPNPNNPNDRKVDYNIISKISNWKNYLSTHLVTVLYDTFLKDKEDYKIPSSVVESTNDYKVETDYCQEWFSEGVQVTEKKEDCIVWSNMYVEFTKWFRAHHPNEKVPSKKVVKPQMEKIIRVPCAPRFNCKTKKTFNGWTGLQYKFY
jgi:phage/plasmid-associated DNA primase